MSDKEYLATGLIFWAEDDCEESGSQNHFWTAVTRVAA